MRTIPVLLTFLAAFATSGAADRAGDPGSVRITFTGDAAGEFSARGPARPFRAGTGPVVYAMGSDGNAIVIAVTANGEMTLAVPTKPGEYTCASPQKCDLGGRFVAPGAAGAPTRADAYNSDTPNTGTVTILPSPPGRVRGTFAIKMYSETSTPRVRTVDLSGSFDAEFMDPAVVDAYLTGS